MNKIKGIKLRKTGLYLMAAAGSLFLVTCLIYFISVITEYGESPVLSGVLIGLFFGVIPFAILLLAVHLEAAGALAGMIMSALTLALFGLGGYEYVASFRYPVIVESSLFLAGSVFLLLDSMREKD